MRRIVILVTFGAAVAAFGALACGGGDDKPPLTPDPEHPADTSEAGAPGEAPPAR